ncbi:hypothetical protein EMO49_17460, partial [Escherichia coli]|nr:hypothetical protein [Escherichia coli]
AFMMFCTMTFYPGWMSVDSTTQYYESLTGHYNSWQPVIMAWWWSKLNLIDSGPGIFLIQNQICYWLGLYLLSITLHKRIGYLSIAILIAGAAPQVILITAQIWKDVVFSSLMILSIGITFNSIENNKQSITRLIILILIMALACGSKTNGIPVALVIMAWWFYYDKKCNSIYKKVSFYIVSNVIIIALPVLIVSTLTVTKTSPLQYIQSYDLLGMSVEKGDILLPEYIVDKVGITKNNVKSFYWPGSNNLMFYNTKAGNLTTENSDEINALGKKWIYEIKNNPLSYLKVRLDTFNELLRVGSSTPAWVVQEGSVENQWGFSFTPNKASSLYVETVKSMPYIYLPWIYLLLALVSTISFIFIRSSIKCIGLLLGVSCFIFAVPHFFVSPASDYRYLHFSILCSLVQFVILLGFIIKRMR